MREAGQTSWRIGIDEPQPLVIGLFVRDVAGLKSRHVWLPHAVPTTPRANGEGSEDAARQWDLWWDRALQFDWTMDGQSQEQLAALWWTPPDFDSLRSTPALQAVVARHFSDAVAWSRDRKLEHVELMIGAPDPRHFHRGRSGRGLVESTGGISPPSCRLSSKRREPDWTRQVADSEPLGSASRNALNSSYESESR